MAVRHGVRAICHATFADDEVMWDNLHTRQWPWEPADRRLAATMADAWARFMQAGDPNGGGLPHWPALGARPEHAVMRLGDVTGLAPPARLAALRLLDRLL